MNWTIQNESPVGYEPVYSVVELHTGRDIATNLEEDEALQIAHCEEAFYIIKDLVEIFDELYVNSSSKDEDFLKYASASIIEAQRLLAKVKK